MLLPTAAHGSAIQRFWCSTQRSRSVDISFTTFSEFTVHCLYFFHLDFALAFWFSLFGWKPLFMFDRQHLDVPSDSSDTTVHLAIQGLHNTLYVLRRQQLRFNRLVIFLFSGLILCNLLQICLILYIVLHQRSHDI